jgi:hypothetical protein
LCEEDDPQSVIAMTDLFAHRECRAIHQRNRIVLTGGPRASLNSELAALQA